MALSAREQESLRAIAAGLETEDPGLAAVFTCFTAHAARLRARPGSGSAPVRPGTVTVLPNRAPRRAQHRVMWAALLLAGLGCLAGMALHNLWVLLVGFQLVAVLVLVVPLATSGGSRPAVRYQSTDGSRPLRRHSSR